MINLDALALKAFNPDPANQTQRDIQDALLRYFTLKQLNDSEEYLASSITGANRVPPMQDTQDLDQAENSPSFGQGILAALGLNAESRLKSSPRTPEVTKRDFSELEKALARRGGPPRAGGLTPILEEAAAYGGRIKRGGTGAAALRRAIGSL